MEPITTSIIASAVYDLLKKSLALGASQLKQSLARWIKDDSEAKTVSEALSTLNLNDGMSEKAITEKLNRSEVIPQLIEKINNRQNSITSSAITTVNQTHSGSGDNVAGNKIIK